MSHWLVCILIIFFGGFSMILTVNELTRTGFQRGSIDINNRFSQESFSYVTNGVFFSPCSDNFDLFVYEELALLPVPSFAGDVFEYYLEFNGNVIFDAEIGERFVRATIPFSFYYIDGSYIITANLNIQILFWNMRTELRVTVQGFQEQALMHAFLLDNTFRLHINEIK